MTIAIVGAKGMLGTDLSLLLKNRSPFLLDIDEIDITCENSVSEIFGKIRPTIIINCAAYTNVEGAEEETEKAFKINHVGPKNLTSYAKKTGTLLCHISTDYVFDGKKDSSYKEDDPTSPTGVYGKSKLAGEKEVRKLDKFYIIRTSWLYGKNGKNFISTISNIAKTRPEIKVVNDQFGSPTYTVDLSKRIVEIIDTKLSYGIYHATNSGQATWFELAEKALEIQGIETKVIPVTTDQYPTKVVRPKYSVLSNEKTIQAGIAPMPSWQDALKRYLT